MALSEEPPVALGQDRAARRPGGGRRGCTEKGLGRRLGRNSLCLFLKQNRPAFRPGVLRPCDTSGPAPLTQKSFRPAEPLRRGWGGCARSTLRACPPKRTTCTRVRAAHRRAVARPERAGRGGGVSREGASASSSPPRERLRGVASTGRETPAEDPAVAARLGLIVPFAAALRHGVAFFTRQRHRHARLSPSVRRGSRRGEAAGRQHLALSPGGPLLAVCWGAREGENSITPPPSRSQGQISAAVFQPPSSTPELSPRAS